MTISADIICDGHGLIAAEVLWLTAQGAVEQTIALEPQGNDRYQGQVILEHCGEYQFQIRAWLDSYQTWLQEVTKKYGAGQDIGLQIRRGIELLRAKSRHLEGPAQAFVLDQAQLLEVQTRVEDSLELARGRRLKELLRSAERLGSAVTLSSPYSVEVERKLAGFSAWYELFPRSAGRGLEHGSLAEVIALLPRVAKMGFDILYLPPIHPIGHSSRKGKDNTLPADAKDPGSPWAIGSEQGGHRSIHPNLGTLEDFDRLVVEAKGWGLELALDLAFQCSPDHPYLRQHPEWFAWLPDGSICHAENPPKVYQDVVPFDFDSPNWPELWQELKSVTLFWCARGVRVFRVDNPHTKPFAFWDWLLKEVKTEYPGTLFLAEAFTRPKVMYRLAKSGFSQSYTYFTWRNTKSELTDYFQGLVFGRPRQFFRPNLWPNTPDILPEFLQYGGRPAFVIRLILAATLAANYGIYGPAFELCETEALPGREEYVRSEKYELRDWDWDRPGDLQGLIRAVNRIRRENPALQDSFNLSFLDTDNPQILAYTKSDPSRENLVLVVVSLDPFLPQTGQLFLPLAELGLDDNRPYLVQDLIANEYLFWRGPNPRLTLDPGSQPARIFCLRQGFHREQDFAYFI
jgi:starch synthase (maltosyl-transferring)